MLDDASVKKKKKKRKKRIKKRESSLSRKPEKATWAKK
jgi:hypothetical protein